VLLVLLVVSVSYGDYNISPLDVIRATVGLETSDPNDRLVVRSIRLPRILVSLLVGVALAVSGIIMQGVTRNDLADPGLLGVNAGAGAVVVSYLVFASEPNNAVVPWLAFAGALGVSMLSYVLAWRGGISQLRLVLVGVGLASLGSSVISFLLTRLQIDRAQDALIWLTGSVYGSQWGDVRQLVTWLLVLLPAVVLLARELNALSLGDLPATSLGMRIGLKRLLLIAASAGFAAITVTVAGTIAFVGFVAPHIARRLVGPSHEGLLITGVLVGAIIMVGADLASRWVIAPAQLPIGVTTALIGAPYFAYLLLRRTR
jgi:iron complex transport system permease protein